MSNWKSTVLGIALMILFWILNDPEDFAKYKMLYHFAQFTFSAGIGIVGLLLKDSAFSSLTDLLPGKKSQEGEIKK